MYINYHLLFVYLCTTFVACNDGQETCLSEEIEDSPEEKNGEENEVRLLNDLESETKYGDDIVELTSDDACIEDTKTNEQTENVEEDIGKKPPNTPNKRNSFFSELSEKLRLKNSSDNGIAEGNNSKRNSLENKDDIYDHTDFEGNSEKTLGVGEAGADNGKSGKEEAHDKGMKDKNAKAQTIGVGKEEFERKKKEIGSKLGAIHASRINNNATVNKPTSSPETVNGDLKNVSNLAPASSHTITTLAPPPPPYPGNFSRPPNM